MKVKEKNGRASRVIKEITFHLYRWMNSLLYHHRSLKTHSIIALNAHHHFISYETFFNEDKPPGNKNPNSFTWDNQSQREGKNSLIKAKNLSNLYVFIIQRLEGLLMDQHILKFYFSLSSYLKGQKAK